MAEGRSSVWLYAVVSFLNASLSSYSRWSVPRSANAVACRVVANMSSTRLGDGRSGGGEREVYFVGSRCLKVWQEVDPVMEAVQDMIGSVASESVVGFGFPTSDSSFPS